MILQLPIQLPVLLPVTLNSPQFVVVRKLEMRIKVDMNKCCWQCNNYVNYVCNFVLIKGLFILQSCLSRWIYVVSPTMNTGPVFLLPVEMLSLRSFTVLPSDILLICSLHFLFLLSTHSLIFSTLHNLLIAHFFLYHVRFFL